MLENRGVMYYCTRYLISLVPCFRKCCLRVYFDFAFSSIFSLEMAFSKMFVDSSLHIEFYENVFETPANLFQRLEEEVVYMPAENCKVIVRGKEYAVSRQIAAYGDDNMSYRFSGLTVNCQPWTPLFLEIKNHVENITGARYNFVLVNRYKDGTSYIGQHKDNEPDLEQEQPIASVSFGQNRTMIFKRPKHADQQVELKDNSLLVMRPPTNLLWTHGISAEKQKTGVRLNLTFRRMKTEKPTQEEKIEKTLKRKADDDDDDEIGRAHV